MSTHVSETVPEPLPPLSIAAALVAMVALWPSSGQIVLLPLGVALALSSRARKRFDGGSSRVRLARLAFFGIVVARTVIHFRADDGDSVEMIFAWAVGLACAGEMTIQAWLQKPLGGARGAIIIFLSGMVMMAASNTYDARFIRFLAPLYLFLLALSLHSFGGSSGGQRARFDSSRMRHTALVLAMTLGAVVHWGVWRNRFQLEQLGARLLTQAPRPESIGLSTSPKLGETFGEEGGLGRVLRIEGKNVPGHWRAMAFDSYDNGRWTPLADKRPFAPFTLATKSQSNRRLNTFRVERILDDRGLVFAPLGVQNIASPPEGKLEWAGESGGPLRSVDPAPFPYVYEVSAALDEDAPSRMSTHVAAQERLRCLQVPDSVSPRVRELARRIGGEERDARRKVQMVQSYLMSHHRYSLRFRPGVGDPVSSFLLSDKGAHCEYFAASSVLLLRCLGVPSRYVIGYYAHESDGANVTVVRSRDAHAWAESWIDGRGWTTVDSTPGDGRPDKTGEPLPFWLHVRERVQNAMRTARNLVAQMRQSPREALGVAAFCFAIVALVVWLKGKRRSTTQTSGFAYAAPDEELQALAKRFERAMHKRGLKCPPQQTWDEYLAATANQGAPDNNNSLAQTKSTHTHSPLLSKEARTSSEMQDENATRQARRAANFVSLYNAARFGGEANSQLNTLRDLLRELETRHTDFGLRAAKENR